MDISDIIRDSIVYPTHNIKALLVYIVLGIIAGIAGGTTVIGFLLMASGKNAIVSTGVSVTGLFIFIVLTLLIQGYTLDILKFGIERNDDAPDVDIVRQVVNAVKYIIVSVVYYIIPVIISWLLFVLLGHGILTTVIVFLLYILFSLANFMGICRLAKTDSLMDALSIGEAIGDISRVGLLKLVTVLIITVVILAVLVLISAALSNYNSILGGIVLGIFGVYFDFFYHRSVGLLYSEV